MLDPKLLTDNGVDVQSSLNLFGDIQTYNDNLDKFLKGLETRIKELDNFKKNTDLPSYSNAVHLINSDSKYFGFTKLAELSNEHEVKSRNNDYDYVNANYDTLVEEINRVMNLVKEYMGWDSKGSVSTGNSDDKKNNSILVVDDSNIIGNFITRIFKDTYNVIIAKDGAEAINRLSMPQGIRAMLLDLNMPNVDGYQVLNFMQINNLFNSINVCIISGTDSKEVLESTKKYPIKAILEKPFNEANIKKVIEIISK